jgi:hypothetical protein
MLSSSNVWRHEREELSRNVGEFMKKVGWDVGERRGISYIHAYQTSEPYQSTPNPTAEHGLTPRH